MGLFVQEDKRSELQQKIAADIQARQRARDIENAKTHDGVEDSRLTEGTGRTSKLGIILLLLLVMAGLTTLIIVSIHK